jgi:predicted nucleic acid-binding protein
MSPQLQQILIDIDRLSSAEQLQVVEHITTKNREVMSTTPVQESKSWRDLAGIAPNLLNGEDAQAWVNRERNEWSQWEEKILSR